ncbi:MAG: Grx4 family monothiol glutaredoxin [Candidatus Binataceae bacterium]
MSSAIDRIQAAIAENKVMVFMKGNRNFPQCGFSAATVQVLEELGAPYETCDVLSDPELRDAIKTYSNWPTIPQVYVNGKFVGGCDIVRELYESGELQTMVSEAIREPSKLAAH